MAGTSPPAPLTARRTPRRRLPRAEAAAAVLATALTVAACGGSTSTDVIDNGPVVDTSTLAGTWSGTVDGGSDPNSFGFARTTTLLKADSTLSSTSDNPGYCAISGTWTVSGAQFTAIARDCGGTVITFVAPLSPLRLTGTWTATSGRTGNFTMAKVP